MAKLKYQPGVLAWAIDVKTFKISYLLVGKSPQEPFPYDPNRCLVGIFVRSEG